MASGSTSARARKDTAASARDTLPSAAPATADTKARRAKPKAPPATLILFVRHGTTPTTGQVLPGRAAGLHLADTGRAEAEAVADRLALLTGAGANATVTANGSTPRHAIAAVYASPLERARETAAPIGRALRLKVVIERGLIEMDFGEWTGAELKALRKLPEWTAVQRHPSGFQFPGGEAFSAMQARMAATVGRLCLRHPGETIVAVSHADPIKTAVSDALGTHLDLFQRISIAPCSVSAVSYSPAAPIVLAVNTTSGIGDLRPPLP